MEKIPSFAKKIADKAKKTSIYAATALSTMGSYANAAETLPDISANSIEVSAADDHLASSPGGIIYTPFDEGGPDGDVETGASLEGEAINLVTYFDMGSAEFSKESQSKISVEISNFLANLGVDQVDGIRKLELAIVVRAGCSSESVDGPYTTAGYEISDNADLAIARASEISKLVEVQLSDAGISGAQIEIHTPKDGISPTNERYAEVGLTEIVREMKLSEFPDDTYGVILDKSGSMIEDAALVRETVAEMNEGSSQDIKILSLRGGAAESHLRSLEEYLGLEEAASDKEISKQDTPKKLYILSDEFDETVSQVYTTISDAVYENSKERYLLRMQEVLRVAKEKNIEIIARVVNPNHDVGGYKEVNLVENPLALIPTQKLESLRAKAYRLYEGLDIQK